MTAGFVVVLLVLAWMLIYVEIVTRFFVKIILGIVVKTIFTIVSPSLIKFGVSAGILFVLRHPAILPDEQTKVGRCKLNRCMLASRVETAWN